MNLSTMDGLNESQVKAVSLNEGPVLVLAGAGSGKTRVITHKIAYLLSQGVKPQEILALTFTNKAAREMKERVKALVDTSFKDLLITTFHSFGLNILRKEYFSLGYLKDFSIFDKSDNEMVIKEILEDLKLSQDDYPVGLMLYLISKAKDELKSPSDIAEQPLREVFGLYEERLKLNNAFDLDDLIYKPVQLFMENTELSKEWASRCRYILVDEYQDSNYSQSYFLKQLSSVHHNICVVGDDDQSIYGFRGADIGNILRFGKDFKGAQTVVLNMNYRNSLRILESAYEVIGNNLKRHAKKVESFHKDPACDKIIVYEALDPQEEAQWIATQIFSHRIEKKMAYQSQAILCRTNGQIRVLEKALRYQNIPYIVVGGYSFYERAEIKMLLAYLRLLYNENDNQAFFRVAQFPKRGIGQKLLEKLSNCSVQYKTSIFALAFSIEEFKEFSNKEKEKVGELALQLKQFKEENNSVLLSELIENLYSSFNFRETLTKIYKEESENRIKALNELYFIVKDSENRRKLKGEEPYELKDFLQEVLLTTIKEEDKKDGEEKDATFIITIHSAKGLEYEAVFIPGFEEEIFPHKRSLNTTESAIEEERRLCYVAFTRAKRNLYLSYCNTRTFYKEEKSPNPSRFLSEIPQAHLEFWNNEKKEKEFEESGGGLLYLEKIKEVLKKEDMC
jgi:DNA helicase-2/ATP-dependent DNA helicase PcrA